MIDFITLLKPLTESEIIFVVKKNGLKTNSRNGVVFYDNEEEKNLKQHNGVFIRIETTCRLKIECSLHKYWNETSGKERNNYNRFSMPDAKKAFDRLLRDKGIDFKDLNIYNYEIGLNLNVSKDCRAYMDKMTGIGASGSEKPLFVNPRYKDRRVKTTVFHERARKYFKVYDKVYESKEKKRKVIPDGNILRIETVNRRLDNFGAFDFFSRDNLAKLFDQFFRDWRTLQFERDLITPKGTGRARQKLCEEIIRDGKEKVLTRARERHKNGSLKDWEYRNIREFIANEWDALKGRITFVRSDEEAEFRKLLNVNYTLLKHDEIIK
ncbi:MAG: hypothetical protein LBG96_16675 [Tannerella sp.]|jgi:hypothetical protein|nr:hypothetical protein [Tannerella sp.]